jgi:hypothetical protein
MKLPVSTFIAIFLLGLLSNGSSQEKLILTNYCVFDGSRINSGKEIEIYKINFTSDQEAQDALARIMKFTGLEQNFEIYPANVANAEAGIEGTRRLILYNRDFMKKVRDATSTEWSEISILAHEVGHHLQGHTLLPGGSRPKMELEADKYSGFILNRMNASLDQAQAAMKLIATDKGSETHPGKQARLAAISNGWLDAQKIDNRPSPPPIPSVQESITGIWNLNGNTDKLTAAVQRPDGQIVLINEIDGRTIGKLVGPRTLLAPDSGEWSQITGVIDEQNRIITWSSNVTWQRSQNSRIGLTDIWYLNGRADKACILIQRPDGRIILINEIDGRTVGEMKAGRLVAQASKEWSPSITGTIEQAGKVIRWSSGPTWERQPKP